MKYYMQIILFLFFTVAIMSSQSSASQSTVAVAVSQIGNGEISCDNCGEYVKQYNRGLEAAWCAGFASWVMHQSGRMDGRYYLRARDYWKNEKHVSDPRPGDVVVFSRGNNPELGHVGILEKISGETMVVIEGNSGKFPAKVKRVCYSKKPKTLLGFVRPQ